MGSGAAGSQGPGRRGGSADLGMVDGVAENSRPVTDRLWVNGISAVEAAPDSVRARLLIDRALGKPRSAVGAEAPEDTLCSGRR